MFYSKNKRLYDLILDKLNENTQGVIFDGNFMFKFLQPQLNVFPFEIISLSDTTLDFEATEIVPFVDVNSIQVPFVEKNKRDDFEREFYVAIKIPKTTNAVTGNMEIVFKESNPQYQALLETIENLTDSLTFIEGDYKYTFKVKEPTKVNVMTYSNTKYQLLSITFNLTSLKTGFFGNETAVYFGLASDTSFDETDDYFLDTMNFTEIVAKTVRDNSNSNSSDTSFSVDKRTWEIPTIVINFNGNIADMLIYKEKTAQSDMDLVYQIKITNKNLNTLAGENLDYTYNVIISNVNAVTKNNVVQQLTFKLERA